MEIERYKSGNYKRQYHYSSFSPEPINHRWTGLDDRIEYLLNEANRKLGELNAISNLIPDVNFFIEMYITREATQSSRIEGTKTSMEEAVQSEENIDPEKRDDWKEVQNYIKALNFAIQQLDILPLSNRLLKQTHHKLLQGVRGSFKSPGEFRVSQNWIGGASLKEALFIPPHWEELPELMGDLENFLNNVDLPVSHLVRIGIAHYQFETIHPFLDGNGRLGRLLITLYLVSNGIINKPVLYISDFFERNKEAYYKHLHEARNNNKLGDWLHFFLAGVVETATNSIETFKEIIELRKEVEEVKISKFGKKTDLALRLVNYLYGKPIAEASKIAKVLEIHISTAYRLLKDFEEAGIIKEKTGYKRNRVFIFESYLRIFDRGERVLPIISKERKNMGMDISASQLDLFSEGTTYFINKRGLRFCVKKHHGEISKLHYDLRLQFNDLVLKSFAIKPEISMNPGVTAKATLVEDHEMNAFRREGTILDGSGQGPVLHFDEGYFTIPGVRNLKELRKALENGLAMGNLDILFDGYKIKGEFSLQRIGEGISSNWLIQKKDDEYASKISYSPPEESLLTGFTLDYYTILYEKQKDILKTLSSLEKIKFIRQNNGESFKFNHLVLQERPDKLLPYD